MLVRILVDNPGRTFTRNLDAKFVGTIKDLLRQGKDLSVQQILRESIEAFEKDKKDDENLTPLLEMWAKEKKTMEKMYGGGAGGPRTLNAPPFGQAPQQNYFARNHKTRGLPPAPELAGRIEEARTSAKLLLQVVQSTPPSEILGNDLIKEFANRCGAASRSVQGYINAEDPAPDDDTLLTLIETNDQLSLAMSKHQRAVLQARKALASQVDSSPPQSASTKEEDPFADENEPQAPQPGQKWQQNPPQPSYDGGFQGFSGYETRPLGQPAAMRGARQSRSEGDPVSPVVSLSQKNPQTTFFLANMGVLPESATETDVISLLRGWGVKDLFTS
ncbi:hypothetical protein GP486_005594 [Trichoglossum hirsutum]|uniref:GAT domain-containing protein n=1 Tax=Trichoglossum hirsutum TaxID=265104 RepID=A0A9P8RLY9_9PEZI|nr:hypothetical protein GP486_005594 [Trichoglossum hirsutum]